MPNQTSPHALCLSRDFRRLVSGESNRRALVSKDMLEILETTLEGAGLCTPVGAMDGFIGADTIIVDDPLKPEEPHCPPLARAR